MAEFASNGKGNLGVVLGSIGTGAAAVEAIVSLINNHSKNTQGGNDCSDNQTVNRYELSLISEIGKLNTELKLRDSSIYTDSRILDTYKNLNGEIKDIRNTLAAQAVHNQKIADAFEMVRNDMICCKNELYTAIARERDDRCCADNSIVSYVNSNFYPRQIADITTGTTSTAQVLYNPLPNCGKCCNG